MSRSLSVRRRLGYRSGNGWQQEGAQARRDGLPVTACPYHGSGRGKRASWLKGYNNARTQS